MRSKKATVKKQNSILDMNRQLERWVIFSIRALLNGHVNLHVSPSLFI